MLVIGFDDPGVNIAVIREFARALDDVLTRYPDVEVQSVRVVDGLPNMTVAVGSVPSGGRSGCGYAERIAIDADAAANPALAESIYATTVQKFAMALDGTGHLAASLRAESVLRQRYAEWYAGSSADAGFGFDAWVGELGPDVIGADGRFDSARALQLAFESVERLQGQASEPARLLHGLMLAEVDAAVEAARCGPKPALLQTRP